MDCTTTFELHAPGVESSPPPVSGPPKKKREEARRRKYVDRFVLAIQDLEVVFGSRKAQAMLIAAASTLSIDPRN